MKRVVAPSSRVPKRTQFEGALGDREQGVIDANEAVGPDGFEAGVLLVVLAPRLGAAVLLDVVQKFSYSLWVVLEMSQSDIAGIAQQLPNFAGLMVVVYAWLVRNPKHGVPTGCATPRLSNEHSSPFP